MHDGRGVRLRLSRSCSGGSRTLNRRLDDADPGPGYDGLIARSAIYPDGHFLGWTPGQVAPLLPADLAWRLGPHTDLVVELHMQPSGKTEQVAPSIKTILTNTDGPFGDVFKQLSSPSGNGNTPTAPRKSPAAILPAIPAMLFNEFVMRANVCANTPTSSERS